MRWGSMHMVFFNIREFDGAGKAITGIRGQAKK